MTEKYIQTLKVMILISALFITISEAHASSAAGISPSFVEIPFFPGYEQRMDFRITGYHAIELKFNCPYVHPVNETINDEPGMESSFSLDIKLPDKIDALPGIYDCGFAVHRWRDPNMPPGVAAQAEVAGILNIRIPEKGRYALLTIEANNANKDEPIYFHATIKNIGEEDLRGINVKIEVMDIENKTKEVLWTESKDVPRYSTVDLWKRMETTNYEPAKYKARATVSYGGPMPAVAETEFLIGKLFVNFVSMQINATAGKINPAVVNVESWWGNPIENVHAEVRMFNDSGIPAGDFKTDSIELSAWQKASVKGYWDATDIEPGNYTANITLKYKGGETYANAKIVLKEPEKKTIAANAIEKAKEVLTSPMFIALLVIILVINVSIWLLKGRRDKKRGAKNEKK